MKVLSKPKIAFVIHDINKTGGQERSTLELIHFLSPFFEVHVYASSFSDLDPQVIPHKVPVFLRRPVFVKDFFFRICSYFMLMFRNFDLIHATGSCSLIADVVTVQFCQKKWMQERNKLPQQKGIRWLLQEFQAHYDNVMEKFVYWFLRKKQFIAISQLVQDDLRNFFHLGLITLIPHGVNLSEFSFNPGKRLEVRKSLQILNDEIVLLFVGTFERKGLFFLLPPLAQLMKKYQLKLCVVGSGPIKRLKESAQKLGVLDQIIITGHSNQVSQYYQASDLFILPSLYDPYGLVGIEALASGLPSIISKQSGVAELIQDGVNGFVLKDPTNQEELLLTLQKMLDQKMTYDQIKEKVRKSVTEYDWTVIGPRYRKLFESVIKK